MPKFYVTAIDTANSNQPVNIDNNSLGKVVTAVDSAGAVALYNQYWGPARPNMPVRVIVIGDIELFAPTLSVTYAAPVAPADPPDSPHS